MNFIHDVLCFPGSLDIDYDKVRRNDSILALLNDDVMITL